MATDLVPNSSSFETTSMKPDVDDGGTADWAQKIAENTGFNWLGMTNKPRISFGTKDINIATGSDTVITFSSDKLDGVNTFTSSTSYIVVLQIRENTATFQDFSTHIITRTTTSCTVRALGTGTGTFEFFWVAFGW